MTPLPARADVVVVGAGVMGASIAFHLAARGADVLLLDRGAVCSGTTRHSTAIVGLHHAEPLLVRMAAHGLRTYAAFDRHVGGASGFTRTGMLFGVDPRDRQMLESNVAVGRGEGVETHLLDAEQLAELDPRVVGDDLVVCFDPGAGYCDPYLVTVGYAAAAARAGATIAEGVPVERVGPRRVETAAGRVDAATVVVAAGVWSAELLVPLGYALDVRAARAEVGRYRLPVGFGTPPPAVADFSAARLYFRPAEPGYLEVGSLDPRHAEHAVEPDAVPEGADVETLHLYEASLHRRLRGSAGGHWRGAWSGVYDVTPDREPVIGRVPGVDGVVVAAGFSGHGFELAPAVGACVAEIVADGDATSFDLGALAADRFARGALVGGRHGYSVLG